MKVFLAWSGERSKQAAIALREWLPDVIQTLEPWVSEIDIEAGERWGREIEDQLDKSHFGILCVTRDNPNAPWLLFEAGALAKTVESSKVCPYLLDHDATTDLPAGPLTRFQAQLASREGTWSVVSSLNATLGEEDTLSLERLERAFERSWPDLREQLDNLPDIDEEAGEARDPDEMLSEILEEVRFISRRASEWPQQGSLRDRALLSALLTASTARPDISLAGLPTVSGSTSGLLGEISQEGGEGSIAETVERLLDDGIAHETSRDVPPPETDVTENGEEDTEQ